MRLAWAEMRTVPPRAGRVARVMGGGWRMVGWRWKGVLAGVAGQAQTTGLTTYPFWFERVDRVPLSTDWRQRSGLDDTR